MGILRKPDRVTLDNTLAPAELDVTVDRARIALAVTLIDEALNGEALNGERSGPRLTNALLEVRHALAPGMRPLDPPVPVIPGRAS
jgi:hypothetical protein